MRRQLVLLHGRGQHGADPAQMKAEWLAALTRGLRKNGLSPPADDGVRLAYYGDALQQLTAGMSTSAAPVISRGQAGDDGLREFLGDVAREAQQRFEITDSQVAADSETTATERGMGSWPWTLAVLRAVDRRVPAAGAVGIFAVFSDVWAYLSNPGVRAHINDGVSRSLSPDAESVVVGHSLGSVVAYSLLRTEGEARGWRVPLLVTVGSPLAVSAVKDRVRALASLRCPPCAARWVNARCERDAVALHPLTPAHFPLSPAEPAIDNHETARDPAQPPHSVLAYLSDATVAREIHDALRG
jgi:hypothetical protein